MRRIFFVKPFFGKFVYQGAQILSKFGQNQIFANYRRTVDLAIFLHIDNIVDRKKIHIFNHTQNWARNDSLGATDAQNGQGAGLSEIFAVLN